MSEPLLVGVAGRTIYAVEGQGWEGSDSAESEDRAFHVVLRGYDRLEVDARLAYLDSELAAADQALQEAEERNAELTGQLQRAQEQLGQRSDMTSQNSFGFRVEKILRLAEEEAKGVRAQAATEAAEVVEQARAETQALCEEAEKLRSAAHDQAEQIRKQAETNAKALATDAEKSADDRRKATEQELKRLTALRDQLFADLSRIQDLLTKALSSRPEAAISSSATVPMQPGRQQAPPAGAAARPTQRSTG